MTPIAQLCHLSSSLSYHFVLDVASELGAPIGRSTAVAEQHRVAVVAEDLGAHESETESKAKTKHVSYGPLASWLEQPPLLTDYVDRLHGPVGRRGHRRGGGEWGIRRAASFHAAV